MPAAARHRHATAARQLTLCPTREPAAPGARASTPRARSLEKAVEELQKDFEKAMEAVVGAIRQNHSVTEQQMTQAMMANQADLEVQAALAALRAAMNGTEPPKVAVEAEAAKLKTSRRTGKSRRKG